MTTIPDDPADKPDEVEPNPPAAPDAGADGEPDEDRPASIS
jgi:hypothetical protein